MFEIYFESGKLGNIKLDGELGNLLLGELIKDGVIVWGHICPFPLFLTTRSIIRATLKKKKNRGHRVISAHQKDQEKKKKKKNPA